METIDARNEIERRRDEFQRRIEKTEAVCREIGHLIGADYELACLILALVVRAKGIPREVA